MQCLLPLLLLALTASWASADPAVIRDFPSLQLAIQQANNQPAASPTPTLTLEGMILVTGQLNITVPLVLAGSSAVTPSGLQSPQNSTALLPFGALTISVGGVTLRDLNFTGFQETAVVVQAPAGGAPQGAVSPPVALERCTFFNNRGGLAGGVEVQSLLGPSNVTFTACTFTGNALVKGTPLPLRVTAAAAVVGGPGTYAFTACTFTNNGKAEAVGVTYRYCASCVTPTSSSVVHLNWAPADTPAWAADLQSNAWVAAAGVTNTATPLLHLTMEGTTFINNYVVGTESLNCTRPEYSLATAVLSVRVGPLAAAGCVVGVSSANFSANSGSSMSVFGDDGTSYCSVAVQGTTFASNVGLSTGSDWPTGGTLAFVNQANILVDSCNFTGNTGSNSALRVVQVYQATVKGAIFDYNSAMWPGGGLSVTSINYLEVTLCTFANNFAYIMGGALNLFAIENALVQNCTFSLNVATEVGGAMQVDNTNLRLEHSSFDGNSARFWGGAVAITNGRYTALAGLNFSNNAAFGGGALYIFAGECYGTTNVTDCTFSDNAAGSGGGLLIRDNRHGHTLTRCTFLRNNAMQGNDPGTPAIQANVNVLACGMGGGGALCISAAAWVLAVDCIFEGNTAIFGGAVHTATSLICYWRNDCYLFDLVNATMVDNVAIGGGGGALFWQIDKTVNIFCNPALGGHASSMQLFQSDYGVTQVDYIHDYIGFLMSVPQHKLPCTAWVGNRATANGYGDIVASPAQFLVMTTPKVIRAYASTSAIDIQLSALDFYNQSVTTGNPLVNVTTRVSSSGGSVYSQVSAGNVNGTIVFNDLRLRGLAGADYTLTLTSTGVGVARTAVLQPYTVTVHVATCRIGQILSPRHDECNPCGAGFYSINGNGTACTPCPHGAVCNDPVAEDADSGAVGAVTTARNDTLLAALAKALAADSTNAAAAAADAPTGGVIVPLDGYWHSHPFSAQLHACRLPASCTWSGRAPALASLQQALAGGTLHLMAVADYQEVQCAAGQHGNLCAQCAAGYWPDLLSNGCVTCLSPGVNTALYVLACLFSLALICLISASAATTASVIATDGPAMGAAMAPQHCAAIKILVSYLQVLSILYVLPAHWPGFVSVFFAVTKQLSSMSQSMVLLGCSVSPTSVMSRAATGVIVVVLSPAYACLGMLLLWAALAVWLKLRQRLHGEPMHCFVMRGALPSFAVACFFCYTSVAGAILSIFSCVTVDSPGGVAPAALQLGYPHTNAALHSVGSFWRGDLDVQCFEGQHLTLVWAVGVPGLLLFVVGAPLVGALWVLRHHTRVSVPGLVPPSLAAFLFQEYRPACCFWELVVTLRKVLLIVIVVFLRQLSAGLQIMLMQGVMAVALLLEYVVQPLACRRMHALERVSLFATIGTLYISLFFTFANNGATRVALGALLILLNATSAAYIAFRAAGELSAARARHVAATGGAPSSAGGGASSHHAHGQRTRTSNNSSVLMTMGGPGGGGSQAEQLVSQGFKHHVNCTVLTNSYDGSGMPTSTADTPTTQGVGSDSLPASIVDLTSSLPASDGTGLPHRNYLDSPPRVAGAGGHHMVTHPNPVFSANAALVVPSSPGGSSHAAPRSGQFSRGSLTAPHLAGDTFGALYGGAAPSPRTFQEDFHERFG